jgi:hypothetical protein
MAFKQDQIYLWQKESIGGGGEYVSKNNEKKNLLEKKINIISKGIDFYHEQKNENNIEKIKNVDLVSNISKLYVMKIYLNELLLGNSEEIFVLIKDAIQVYISVYIFIHIYILIHICL